MAQSLKEAVALKDLYIAYRKAKADAFFESTHFHAIAYAKYEQNLHRNLKRLLAIILHKPDEAFGSSRFVGAYAYAPKSLDEFKSDGVHSRAVDPIEDWKQRFAAGGESRVRADFRLVMLPTVDFQVFSALWILKVGYRLDARVNRECSFGNRLRSINRLASKSNPDLVEVNEECVGLFVPYFSAYRRWRETGLRRMREALNEGMDIVAITMDVRRFYHCVSPSFLLRSKFLNAMNLELTSDENALTRHLLAGITT